jgi:hypothetical protein
MSQALSEDPSEAFKQVWPEAQAHGWTLKDNTVRIPPHFWCAKESIWWMEVAFEGRIIHVPHAIFNPSFRVCGHWDQSSADRYAARRQELQAIPPPDNVEM